MRGLLVATLLTSCIVTSASATYRFDDDDYLANAERWPAWALTLERHEADRERIERCLADKDACEGKLKSLRYLISRGSDLSRKRQLQLVNRYINKRRYRRDRRELSLSVASEGQAMLRNHWTTLLDFMSRGGDCEDFAAAKYFLLRELGVPAEDMRILVTWEKKARDYHAVLAVRKEDGTAWLLETDDTIVRGSQRRYRFIYALNEEGIWDHEDREKRK